MTPFDESENTVEKNTTANIAEDLKATAREASETVKQQASQTLNNSREKTADKLDNLAHAAHSAASDLENQNQQGLSHYINDLADNVGALANGLRGKSVDELIQEAQNIARKNPVLFIGASIAIGLGIARFAKASSHRSHPDHEFRQQDSENSTLAKSGKISDPDYYAEQEREFSRTNEYSPQNDAGRIPPASSGFKREGNGADISGGNRYE